MRGAQSAFPFNRAYMYRVIYNVQVQGRGRRDHAGAHGDQLLRLIGREPAAKGIIEVAAHAAGDRAPSSRRSPPTSRARKARDEADDEASGRRAASASSSARGR